MSVETVTVNSEFDIFSPRLVQTSVLETTEVTYNPQHLWNRVV